MSCSPRSNPPSSDRSIRGPGSQVNPRRSRDTIGSLLGRAPAREGGERAYGPKCRRCRACNGDEPRLDRNRRKPARALARIRSNADVAHRGELPATGERQRRLLRPLSTSCVAVGDDGGHVASIIVTNNNGSTWSDASSPAGVTSLSTVSCPSALVCYAGGGSGILKSSDGGSSWTVQDSTFPAQSISCFTIDECTAVGGFSILKTTNGATWTSPGSTGRLGFTFQRVVRRRQHMSGSWLCQLESLDRWDTKRK